MKSISSCHYMEIQKIHLWRHTPPESISHSEKWKGNYASFSELSNILQNVLSKRMASWTLLQSMQLQSLPRSGATTNRHLHGRGERNQEQRKALVEPWCKHWSCSGWWKGTSPDKAMLNSEEIKPIALAVIKLHLSEGVSQSDSQSVEKSVK